MKPSDLSLIILFFLAQQSYAQNSQINSTSSDHSSEQDTIIVRATPTSQTMGTQIINAEQIANLPTRNGTVTELLKTNPNVQFSNTVNNSLTGGEIQPENVSFHGEKFYQNNYMIDGLSNNNTINPAANNGALDADPDGYSPTDLPAGGAQSYWINAELLSQVEVYDSNISAKYGDFTGGVVDAKLKDPSLEKASGRVSYRTTRDAWTEFHVDSSISEDFYQASNLYYQPRFKKEFYSLTLNQPISEKLGLIFSYNRQESEIPFYHTVMDSWSTQERLAETYLLKGAYYADSGDIFRATAMYAPHESTYFKKNIKNGAFSNEGGGYRFNLEWEHFADWGKVSSLIGYQYEKNHINHDSDYYVSWYSNYRGTDSAYIDWDSSIGSSSSFGYYGGYGEYKTEKNTYTVKQDYQFEPSIWGKTRHQIDLGWQWDNYDIAYERLRDVYSNSGVATWSSSTTCLTGDNYCIEGEQYYKSVNLYPKRSLEASYSSYASYVQDSIKIGRLEITPGFRVSYDDYLENINIAPRFASSYDVFGNHKTRLFGGANRYYAQNMLAYKLRQGISSYYRLTRTNSDDAWTTGALSTATYDYDISDLDTPYSDELSLGISQRLWNTVWTLKWVKRHGEDQFGRSNYRDDEGQRYYYLTNNARTKGETISLTIAPISPLQFKHAIVSWSVGANYSDHESSSQLYYDMSDTDDNMVIFDGRLMDKGDMPALDYNTPWKVFSTITTEIPKWHLNWTQFLNYTAGYEGYQTSLVTCSSDRSACGTYTGNATLYERTKYSNYLTYDWKFLYKKPIFKGQTLEISLDVTNVFDSTIEASKTTSSSGVVTYQAGRQFWLGAAWNW